MNRWGRRAPFAVLALPLLGFGAFLAWNPPASLGPIGVALWFGFAKFFISTGSTFFFMASTSSMMEIFPVKKERVTVSGLMAYHVMLGLTIAMVLFAKIAFSVDPGSDEQDSTFFVLGVASAALVLLAIPHVFVMTKTKVRDISVSPTLSYCVKTSLGNLSMRYLVIGQFLYSGCVTTATSLMPFYLQYACNIPAKDLGGPLAAVMSAHIGGRMMLALPQALLMRIMHPAKTVACSMLFCAVVCAPLIILSYTLDKWTLNLIVAGVMAINFGLTDIAMKVLLGWVVDEDQVLMTDKGKAGGDPEFLAARRDGVFWCVHSSAQVLGGLFLPIGLAIFGHFSSDSFEQPKTQARAIVGYFLFVMVVNQLIVAVLMMMFPLKGERLEEINEKYQENFAKLQEREKKELP